MKVYEFGKENTKTFVMFQCAAEPWWVFQASAEAMAREYHVWLFIADGHDETGMEFVSIEKNVTDAADHLRKNGVLRVEAMYGVSMGGTSVIRFLATEDIPVDKAIIDAGITPYPYPKWICRLIALWDWFTISLATKNYAIMKAAMPPERWTPKGEDPEEHYRRIFDFEKNHFSSRTIYRNPYSWNMEFLPYADDSGYEARFTKCGICTLMTELGIQEIIPAMCRLDYTMSKAGGSSRFVRQYTLASGGPYCDCGYKKKGRSEH